MRLLTSSRCRDMALPAVRMVHMYRATSKWVADWMRATIGSWTSGARLYL